MLSEKRSHGLENLVKLTGKNREIIETFLTKRDKKNTYTMRTYQTSIDIFFKYFEVGKSLLDIEKRDIMDFFDNLDNDSENWSLESKKQMFSKFRVFLKWFLDYYSKEFYENLESENQLLRKQLEIMQLISYLSDNNNFNWRDKGHKKPESNKEVILDLEQIDVIFTYLRDYYQHHYILYKVILESGCRRGEVVSINLTRKENSHIVPIKEDIQNRLLYMSGKKEDKVYYISEKLKKELLKYLEMRESIESKSNAFFLTNIDREKVKKRYESVNIYHFLRDQVNKLYKSGKLQEPRLSISPHTLRKTTNTLRYNEGLSEMNLKILLGHKTKNVNIKHYLKLKREQYLKLFDESYPYYNIF